MIRHADAERHGVGITGGAGESVAARLNSLIPGAIDSDGVLNADVIMEATGAKYKAHGYRLTFAGDFIARREADTPTEMELKAERTQSKSFDDTENVVIRGDNLDVLKILHNNYYGSVKVVYIDPPYNRESDDFTYKDYFRVNDTDLIEEFGLDQAKIDSLRNLYGTKTHSGWLAFMYPRLKVALDLLADDGIVFISIDDNEQANLRNMCDEIFGASSFIACIVVNVNPGGRAYNEIATNHEYILCYGKGSNAKLNLVPKTNNDLRLEDRNGKYGLKELRNRNPKFTRKNRPNLYYSIYVNPKSANENKECSVSLTKTKLYSVEVLPKNSKDEDDCWRWGKEKTGQNVGSDPSSSEVVARQKKKGGWNVYQKDRSDLTKAQSIWDEKEVITEKGTIRLNELFDEDVFTHPKPVGLVLKCIKLAANEKFLVLDFFAGSGTTGEAVMQFNAECGSQCRFILAQLDERIKKDRSGYQFCVDNDLEPTISNIMLERLDRAGDMIKKEHPNTDTGYKVFSLKTKPKVSADGTLGLDMGQRSAEDELYNMMCSTGKPLDSEITEVVEDALYMVDGELYMLRDADVGKYEDAKINLNGWGDISLERYLNIGKKRLNVVY